jgi:acyl-CoA reductase-like NAD-dependent aldehyde dehydrogenase
MAETLKVRNPLNQELVGELGWQDQAALNEALAKASSQFEKWRIAPSYQRSELLAEVATELETRKEEFAELIRKEAGKPISYARAEVDRGVGVLNWAAAETQRFAGELLRLDTTLSGRPGFGINTRFPRGVILGITPFNFPLNLVLHKIAPAVAAGCSIVIKPSPFTPLTSMKLAELFSKRVPDLVQVVLATDADTAALTSAKEIAFVSFTGSAKVGWTIRKQVPEKPCALELGGNAWALVMEDTPRSAFAGIADRITRAAYGYAGQSCISVQNIAIAESSWKELSEAILASTRKIPFGDTLDPATVSGPVIHLAAAGKIRQKIAALPKHFRSVSSEAGKAVPDSTVIPPTALVTDRSIDEGLTDEIVQEEVFAPLVTLARFSRLEAVIQQVNSSHYGLQAGVYTQDLAKIEMLYRELKVGGLVVNDVPTTRYDHQPYGGVKQSGEAREGIRYAMEEMTYSKFLALSSTLP